MTDTLQINLDSFHDYDIRGIYPDAVDENFFYHLGKSCASYFKTGPIGVGRDTRVSSPSLTTAFIDGMTDYGVPVIDLGTISTEMYNYSLAFHDHQANVIITASHNPPQYNGLKSALKGVIPLYSGFGLPEIKEFMNQDLPKAAEKASVTKKDFFDEWKQFLQDQIDQMSFSSELTVVVDAGNGMGGPIWQEMIASLPFQVEPLYLEPDGTFPNHVADPSKDDNLADLAAAVVEKKAAFGIALDGDADRAVFVDEHGSRVPGTITVALFCEYMLSTKKGVCIYDATVGKIVPETIKKNGGTPVRSRVGHSFIKTQMREKEAVFGGEESGHFYFPRMGNAESSFLAGMMMAALVSAKQQPLSKIVAAYDLYARSGETNFRVPDVDAIMTLLQSRYQNVAQEVDEIDGYTYTFADWWFIVRRSKTEPLLRVFMEAETENLLTEKLQEVSGLIIENGGTRK